MSEEHLYATVDWQSGGRVHNWKNHVPEDVQNLWGTFNLQQRAALYGWAEKLANDEEWD